MNEGRSERTKEGRKDRKNEGRMDGKKLIWFGSTGNKGLDHTQQRCSAKLIPEVREQRLFLSTCALDINSVLLIAMLFQI